MKHGGVSAILDRVAREGLCDETKDGERASSAQICRRASQEEETSAKAW